LITIKTRNKMYEYRANLVRVIDGDTIVFNIDLGFNIWIQKESVRFAYINAPEVRTKDLVEKAKGLVAKEFVQEHCDNLLNSGGHFTLKTFKDFGKYGRFIAEIVLNYPDGTKVNLNNLLLETGHAISVKY